MANRPLERMSEAPRRHWCQFLSSEMKQLTERVLQDKVTATYADFPAFVAVAAWDMFVHSHDEPERPDLEHRGHTLEVDCGGFEFKNENEDNAISAGAAGNKDLLDQLRAMRAKGPIVMTLKGRNAAARILDKDGKQIFAYSMNNLSETFPKKYHTSSTSDGRKAVKS